MAQKIGYDRVANGSVPPPIDSSLEGAPVQSAVQQPVQQPVKATTPPPVDSSLAGAPGATQTTEQKQQEASTNTVQTNNGTSTDTDQPSAGASTDKAQSTSTDENNPGNGTSTEFSDVTIPMDKQIAILEKERDRYDKANETPEQQAKREKREKSQRLIAAIGDGLSSLAGLFATAHYAPYVKQDSQFDKIDARQKELKAEREANRDKYLNYALKIGDLERERASTLRELEAQAEKMKMAREAAQRQAEKHQWEAEIQPERQRKATADANAAESNAKTKDTEAKYAEDYYKGRNALQSEKQNTEKDRQAASRASAAASKASAANSYASARAHDRSNVNEFTAYDEKGRPHSFRTKQAADTYAQQHGTYQQVDKTVTKSTETKDRRGKPKEKSVVSSRTSGGGYARRPTQADNTPPSRRRNNDNTPPSRR